MIAMLELTILALINDFRGGCCCGAALVVLEGGFLDDAAGYSPKDSCTNPIGARDQATGPGFRVAALNARRRLQAWAVRYHSAKTEPCATGIIRINVSGGGGGHRSAAALREIERKG